MMYKGEQMNRFLVVLACTALLVAGVSAGVVGAQSNETAVATDSNETTAATDANETAAAYSLGTNRSVHVHDQRATVDGAEANVSSLIGLYPGEEVLLNVTAPDDELAVVTVRTPNGTVLQKDSVTAGESVLVNSTDYDPGTYHLVLSTGGEVRTVSHLVVSNYRVSYGLGNVTNGTLSGDATVAGGTNDTERVQFVLSNEDNESRTNASEVRNGLYEFSLALDNVSDGNYTAVVEVVEEGDNGSTTVLAASQVRTVTVGEIDADATANGTDANEATDDRTVAPAETETAAQSIGVESGGTGVTESDSPIPIPDIGTVALFGALVSLAVVARVR